MPNTKPYVAVACVCEKVLMEPDAVNSAIRIVDTYTLSVQPQPLPPGLKVPLALTIYVSLKSGDVTGQHNLGLVGHRPSGQNTLSQEWPVVIEGGTPEG